MNGVYFSLELSEGLCSKRIDSMVTGVTSKEIYRSYVLTDEKKFRRASFCVSPDGQFLGERDTWLYNSNMPEAEQLFDLYKSLCSNLNSRWFNNNDYAKGLMGHISRDYIL